MPLIKTIAEIKEVLPKLVSNLNDDALLPNFDAVEQKYLVPVTGTGLYAALQTAYLGASLTDEQKVLVKHMRLLIAAYGFLDELAASHVLLTDNGVRTMSTDNLPKAVGWEYKELKAYLANRTMDATEVLLNYMWDHKADLPLWTGSEAYKRFERLLIRTGTDFNDQYGLSYPMRTFWVLRSVMEDCQENYLVSGIGSELVTYLVTVSDPSTREMAIIKALKKGLANFTIKHAGEKFSVRFTENGFSVFSMFGGDKDSEDSGYTAATQAAIDIKTKACDRDGKDFIAKAKAALVSLRQSGTSSADFNVAFDAGPLTKYINPKERTSGNERRKLFRFR